jgi:hypothetical protein
MLFWLQVPVLKMPGLFSFSVAMVSEVEQLVLSLDLVLTLAGH